MTEKFYKLEPEFEAVIKQTVSGRNLVELGGGSGVFASWMVNAGGSESVLVVEKDVSIWQPLSRTLNLGPKVTFYWGYAQDFNKHPILGRKQWDVAVLSWPPNSRAFDLEAVKVMSRCATVIFVGLNDGTTACGTEVLWNYLVTRERLHFVPGRQNDLLIYGLNPRSADQTTVPTEQFGLSYSLPLSCLTTSPLLQPSRN